MVTITVLPAKSDSDFMFCLKAIDRTLINKQVIYRIALAQVSESS